MELSHVVNGSIYIQQLTNVSLQQILLSCFQLKKWLKMSNNNFNCRHYIQKHCLTHAWFCVENEGS